MNAYRIEAELEQGAIYLYAAACLVCVAWLAFAYGAKLGRQEGRIALPAGGKDDATGGV